MSGICGIIRFDGQTVKKEEIQKMLDAMQNRGNDTEGVWVYGSVGFGHKMLWTTPESLKENQPFISEDGNLAITADARIDNREELFEKLEIDESDFSIVTDVELIIWSYQKWGEECPKYLIGDFVFSIWDMEEEKLFCARDKLGIKPFYYYKNDKCLYFASEVVVLRKMFDCLVRVSKKSIFDMIGFNTIDYENTLFENIKRLRFGAKLVFERSLINIIYYWEPKSLKISYEISYENACEIFLNLLKQSIKARLRSAYPIGCELSGGLDSSSIVCLATCFSEGKDILPFSLRYGDMACDEGKYIEAVLKKIEKSCCSIDVNSLDFQNNCTIESFYKGSPDWPIKGSYLPHLELANRAKEKDVRILLTGHGGDHVATGTIYGILDDLKRFHFIQALDAINKVNNKKLLFLLFLKKILPLKIKTFLIYLKHPKKLFNVRKKLFHDLEETNTISNSYALAEEVGWLFGAKFSYWFDSNTYHKYGAFDIEVRHPFLDSRLVEFMLQLPASYKYKDGVIKRILRDGMEGILPELVRCRTDKAEFSESVQSQLPKDLFQEGRVFNLVESGFLKKNEIDKIIYEYNSGRLQKTLYISFVINLEIWYTNYKINIRKD